MLSVPNNRVTKSFETFNSYQKCPKLPSKFTLQLLILKDWLLTFILPAIPESLEQGLSYRTSVCHVKGWGPGISNLQNQVLDNMTFA